MEYRLKDYEKIIREVMESDGEFTMYPKGTSMLPLILERRDSVTLVKPERPLHAREIILYKRDGGAYVLHRILGKDAKGYILCGDNQEYLEYGIREDQVIGAVKRICRKGKDITRNQTGLRLYEYFWSNMPFRKMYFRLIGHRYPKTIWEKE